MMKRKQVGRKCITAVEKARKRGERWDIEMEEEAQDGLMQAHAAPSGQ